LAFGIEGFESSTPLVVPPLDELVAYRPLQSVYLGFYSGVPGDLPPSPEPVFQAYFILNDSRYRRPWVVTRAKLGSGYRQSLKNGAGDFLNTRVDSHLIV
jgi:hypothetical protein